MGGSLLKNFKSDLRKSELLQSQKKKPKAGQNHKDRRERDRKALDAIRQGYNPFDTKSTRQKFQTVGQASQKSNTTASKSISEKQRQKAYDAQKRIRNRVGGLLDRRFGENDKTMTEEDRMVARYAKERLKQTRNNFSLEDEDDNEVLTHAGHALAFDHFDDFNEPDLQEEEGQALSKPRARDFEGEGSDEEAEEPSRKKSKHEVMQEIIQKSKMHKAARQSEKAELEGMVEDLNDPEAFSALMADLQEFDQSNTPAARTNDLEYDQRIREMAFDRRAVPDNRTKTAEELEKEAEEKKKAQEAARLQRLEGDDLGSAQAENDAELFGLHENIATDSEAESEELEEQVETSQIPTTLGALKDAIHESPAKELKRLFQLCDPSKGEGNKARRGHLLQLCCLYATHNAQHFQTVLTLVRKHAETYEEQFGTFFRAQVDKIHQRPVLKTSDLYMFALIGALFSTSDQWHLVANAATLVITQKLFEDVDYANLKSSIFLCQTVLMYQRVSKRYIPEVSAFLLRLFASCGSSSQAQHLVRLAKHKLELSGEFASVEREPMSVSTEQSTDRLVVEALHTLDTAAELWKTNEAYKEIFEPFVVVLESLPVHPLKDALVSKLSKKLKFFVAERVPLRLQELRPVGIVTQAPQFDDNYNPEARFRNMDEDNREAAKLRSELKRERKSTLKEIRRDAEFETRQRLTEKRKDASEYHTMLQKLTDRIQNEEGAEANRYEREKRGRKNRK